MVERCGFPVHSWDSEEPVGVLRADRSGAHLLLCCQSPAGCSARRHAKCSQAAVRTVSALLRWVIPVQFRQVSDSPSPLRAQAPCGPPAHFRKCWQNAKHLGHPEFHIMSAGGQGVHGTLHCTCMPGSNSMGQSLLSQTIQCLITTVEGIE